MRAGGSTKVGDGGTGHEAVFHGDRTGGSAQGDDRDMKQSIG